MQIESQSISLVEKDVRTGRIVWADNAKAILITLVVLGHFGRLSTDLKTLIYGFHLPAFLFITGFFLSSRLREMSLRVFAAKYILPFARLYIVASLVSVLLWWIAYMALKHHMISPIGAIFNALYGTQWDGHRFIHRNGALWYLPFLVCSLAAFFCVVRLPFWAAVIAIAAYFCLGVFYTGYPLPWSVGGGGAGVAFIYMGYRVRLLLEDDRASGCFTFTRRTLAIAAVAAYAAFVALAFLNGRTNLNLLAFGQYFLLYIPVAVLGIVMVVAISALLPHSKLADDLSTNSLIIFCVHLYGVKAVGVLGLFNGQPLARHIFILFMTVIILIVSMHISKMIMPIVSKFIMGRG